MPANKVINGTDLLLSMDGEVVAHAKSHTISITMDVRDTTSKTSGIWKEKAGGRMDWNTKVDALVSYEATICNYQTMMAAMLARTPVVITSIDNTGGTIVAGLVTPVIGSSILTGDAIITNVELTSGDAENVTFSVTFDGSGPLVASVKAV